MMMGHSNKFWLSFPASIVIVLVLLSEIQAIPAVTLKTSLEELDKNFTDEDKKNYTSERFFTKAFTYIRNSPAFKNHTTQDLIALIHDLETWKAPEYLVKRFPYYLAGYDSEDRPVWMSEVGKYNLRAEVEMGKENIDLCMKYLFQAVYRIIKSMFDKDTPEKEVRHAVFLLDMDGFDLHQLSHTETIALSLEITRDYKEVTQQLLGYVVFVNANYVAQLAVNLFRPILGDLMERMEVFGTNKAKWIPQIRRMLPEHVIPAWYGGTKKFKPIQIYG